MVTVTQAKSLGINMCELDDVEDNGDITYFHWRVNTGYKPDLPFEVEVRYEHGRTLTLPSSVDWGIYRSSWYKNCFNITAWRPDIETLNNILEEGSESVCAAVDEDFPTKEYQYNACNFKHAWEAVRAFEEGVELFINNKGEKPVGEGVHIYCELYDKLFTREEVSILKQVKFELESFLNKNCHIDVYTSFSDFIENPEEEWDGIDYDKAFIDACCIVAKLKGKI